MNTHVIRDHYNAVAEPYKDVRQAQDRILERLQITSEMTVLDVGCGAGNLTFDVARRFCPRQIVGVDISERLIDLARQTQQENGLSCATFSCADAMSLEFGDSTFDVVVSNMVFHLIEDQRKALREAHRVLKPNGNAVLQFQGQRPIAPEYFACLGRSWKQVMGEREFPRLFHIAGLNDIDCWMGELGIERFETAWKSNTVHLPRPQFDGFVKNFELVSGFWRSGLCTSDVEAIETRFREEINGHFRATPTFTLTGNTVLLAFAKNAA